MKWMKDGVMRKWEKGDMDLEERDGDAEDVEQIIPKELDEAVRRMENWKSSSHDRITVEMIKFMGKSG